MPPASPDLRLTPARADIAAAHLRGIVEAPRYVAAERRRVAAASAPLRRKPDPAFAYDSELLHGETFDVYDEAEGWAWGQNITDGYVGYVPAAALAQDCRAPSHRVTSLRTFLYPEANIKAPPLAALPYGALLRVTGNEGRLAHVAEGFVFADHLATPDTPAADPVSEAERFLGIPYLWGGRTSLGIDCSGLVQAVYGASGIAAPRDSDMQEHTLGTAVPIPKDPRDFARGDLLFWAGHVALAQGGGRMVHATAWSMSVLSEEIGGAIARIAGQGHPLRCVRRLSKP